MKKKKEIIAYTFNGFWMPCPHCKKMIVGTMGDQKAVHAMRKWKKIK